MHRGLIVVGAGIAGLALARELRARGHAPVVLERARGVGGRCATRRVEGQPVDHGLAYLHGRSERYGGNPTVMFYAGDDAAAKRMAHELATGLGFDAVDAGPLSRARELEHLALLWISLSVSGHGRDIAFRLVRR